VPETDRNYLDCFLPLNNDCSAQDRLRDLKLVSLELSGNEDSEYAFKTFLACL
jgi:hypothetical protein